MKNKNGITLIALIITIIILLILAMVTIRILMNQGIIKHAQNATAAYDDAQNNETEYLTYAEGEMDKYAGTSGGNGAGDTTDTVPVDLEKYFLGVKEDGSVGTGQDISNVANMTQAGILPASYKDNDIIDDASTSITNLNTMLYDSDTAYVYVKYGNKAYRVTTNYNSSFVFTTKSVDLVYTPDSEGIEGTKKTYKGGEWTVLYNKGDKVEIVSPNNIGTYVLGTDDTNVTGNTDIDKAIDSYNNAIERLNNYCRTTLDDATARSVGSNPSSPDSSTTSTYSSSNTDNWNTDYNGRGLVADSNAEQDYVRMCYWGVASSDTHYVLASRYITEETNSTSLGVRMAVLDFGWTSTFTTLWGVSNGSPDYRSVPSGVRACVTVNK